MKTHLIKVHYTHSTQAEANETLSITRLTQHVVTMASLRSICPFASIQSANRATLEGADEDIEGKGTHPYFPNRVTVVPPTGTALPGP